MSLSFFSVTNSWSRTLVDYVLGILIPIGSSIIAYTPKLLFIVVVIVIARFLIGILKSFFNAIEAGTISIPHFESEWGSATFKIIRVLIMLFSIVAIFPYIPGSDSEAFKGMSIFIGALVSLGSSSFISNIMAGVALTYMSPYRVGEIVKIGETQGCVTEKTLLVTRIRTIKNVVVTLPNTVVMGGQVENLSRLAVEGPLILHTTMTIDYDIPWRTVHELLLSAASKVEHVLAEPRPFILQTALEEDTVKYELNAYTKEPSRIGRTYSDLHQEIQDAFDGAGIALRAVETIEFLDEKARANPQLKSSKKGEAEKGQGR